MAYELVSQNGSHKGAAQPWLRDSVRHFFEQMLWEGRPPITTSDLDRGTGQLSPMTMSVKDFFASVPWDEQPTVAAPLSPLEFQADETPPSEDSMTLDDFFDLF